MSVIKGSPSSDVKAALSSVDGISITTPTVNAQQNYYAVTVKVRVRAAGPAQTAMLVQDILLREQ